MGHNPQSVTLPRLPGIALGQAAPRMRAAPRVLARTSCALALILRTPALILCVLALFSTAALAAPESIQIVRPLDASKEVYLETDDGLLIVPGGRMFLFQVEISALNPWLEVRINGRTHSTPRTKWTFIKLTRFLHRGKNRIVVEARTGSGKARQEFIIELRALPGFGPKPDKPAS